MDQAVQPLLDAINAGDRAAFFAALTPSATMTDDGTARPLEDWVDREIFTVNGRITVDSAAEDGLSTTATFRNDTWGEMRTRWRFIVTDGRVSHFDTGQA